MSMNDWAMQEDIQRDAMKAAKIVETQEKTYPCFIFEGKGYGVTHAWLRERMEYTNPPTEKDIRNVDARIAFFNSRSSVYLDESKLPPKVNVRDLKVDHDPITINPELLDGIFVIAPVVHHSAKSIIASLENGSEVYLSIAEHQGRSVRYGITKAPIAMQGWSTLGQLQLDYRITHVIINPVNSTIHGILVEKLDN